MEKITKKSFIEIMTTTKSCLAGSAFNQTEDAINKVLSQNNTAKFIKNRIGKANSNSIAFTIDGQTEKSYLYLTDGKSRSYYKHENGFIVVYTEYEDGNNFVIYAI